MEPTKRARKIAETYKTTTGEDLIVIDASTFQTQLGSLSTTMINLLEREAAKVKPHPYLNDDLAMMLRQMRTTCDLLFYLNADEKIDGDPSYRQGYGFVFLPLIRSMIDGLYNITALLDDSLRAKQFRSIGYRNILDGLEEDKNRYGTDRRWINYCDQKIRALSIEWRQCGFTEDEIRQAKPWPTLGAYLRNKPTNTPHKLFLSQLTYGFWREYSALSHVTFEGLKAIFPFIGKDRIPREARDRIEDEGHRVLTMHIARASGILLCTLTELQVHYMFPESNIPNRLHIIWDALNQLPEVRELYETRYKSLMLRNRILSGPEIPAEFRRYFKQ